MQHTERRIWVQEIIQVEVREEHFSIRGVPWENSVLKGRKEVNDKKDLRIIPNVEDKETSKRDSESAKDSNGNHQCLSLT